MRMTLARCFPALQVLCAGMFLTMLGPATVFAWQIDSARSLVTFHYEEDGEPRSGTFDRIGGTVDHTTGRIEESKADLKVATASLDLGDALREGVLATGPWLDSEAHPHAIFSLDRLTPLGGNRYEATGSLQIKDKKLPFSFPLLLEDDGREARVRGGLTFKRTDFNLRDVILESFVSIGDFIRLDFDIRSFQDARDKS